VRSLSFSLIRIWLLQWSRAKCSICPSQISSSSSRDFGAAPNNLAHARKQIRSSNFSSVSSGYFKATRYFWKLNVFYWFQTKNGARKYANNGVDADLELEISVPVEVGVNKNWLHPSPLHQHQVFRPL